MHLSPGGDEGHAARCPVVPTRWPCWCWPLLTDAPSTAVHVDHGLARRVGRRERVVAKAADRFGAAFRAERVHVEAGPNLEARARDARRAVLAADALLGHTADDQAETILLNLMRGAGLEGLGGMRRRSPSDPGVAARRDAPAVRRSRARCRRRPDESRSRLSTHARASRVAAAARRHRPARRRARVGPTSGAGAGRGRRARRAQPDTSTRRTRRALRAASPAVARHAVRAWLRDCSDQRHPPDAATVDRVLAVAGGTAKATDVGGGWRVERHQQRLAARASVGHARLGFPPHACRRPGSRRPGSR